MNKFTALALSGFIALSMPALAHKKKEGGIMEEPKYCPKELSLKQIESLAADKKLSLNNMEFLVGKKFDQQAGKRYLTLNKEGKAPAAIALKHEKIKGDKAVCLYAYKFKTVSKKKDDAGKEVERTGRIRTHTILKNEAKPQDKK